jgi:hypothetical protein
MQTRILLSKLMRRDAFDLLDNLSGRSYRVGLHKQMNMVGFDGKFDYLPSLFFALFFNQPFALFAYKPTQNRLATFGSPYQMIENKMYSMLVSDVFHTVDRIAQNDGDNNILFLSVCAYRALTGGLKPVKKPRLTSRIEMRRLAAGLTSVTEYADVQAGLPLHHRDPFDRMLIAQAMVEQIPIVSGDTAFDAYPVQRLW